MDQFYHWLVVEPYPSEKCIVYGDYKWWDNVEDEWDYQLVGYYPLVNVNIAIENGPVEIVALPINSMVIFHSLLWTFTRGWFTIFHHWFTIFRHWFTIFTIDSPLIHHWFTIDSPLIHHGKRFYCTSSSLPKLDPALRLGFTEHSLSTNSIVLRGCLDDVATELLASAWWKAASSKPCDKVRKLQKMMVKWWGNDGEIDEKLEFSTGQTWDSYMFYGFIYGFRVDVWQKLTQNNLLNCWLLTLKSPTPVDFPASWTWPEGKRQKIHAKFMVMKKGCFNKKNVRVNHENDLKWWWWSHLQWFIWGYCR